MAQDEWLRPAALVEDPRTVAWTPGASGVAVPAFHELRPLSLGEILDRTFALYRARFWLFAGLASLSGAVYLLVESLALSAQHLVRQRSGVKAGMTAGLVGGYAAALVFWLVSALILAASTSALSEVYLGREATVASSLRATLPRWYRYLLITLWQGLCMAGPMLLGVLPAVLLVALNRTASGAVIAGLLVGLCVLAGLPVGIWLYLRNAMAVPACVFERLPVRESLRRSRVLTDGVKWKLLVLGLVLVALFMVVGALEAPFTLSIFRDPRQEHIYAQAGLLLVNLLGHIFVAPVATIGLTLFYFDQRVRKEGFDLLVLMGQDLGAPRTPAPFAVPDFGIAQPQSPFVNPYSAPPAGAVASDAPAPPPYAVYPAPPADASREGAPSGDDQALR